MTAAVAADLHFSILKLINLSAASAFCQTQPTANLHILVDFYFFIKIERLKSFAVLQNDNAQF